MKRNLLRGAAGTAISVAALIFLLTQINLAAVADVLRASNGLFVLALLGMTCVDVACRAARWQGLLEPIRHVRFRALLMYLLIGYLANNLLPARLGELVRSHYVGDREGLSRVAVLGTVVVERVVDTAVLAAVAVVTILVLGVQGVVERAVVLGLAVAMLLALFLGLATFWHRLPFAHRLEWAVARWPLAVRAARRLHEGLAVARRPRTLLAAIAWSALAWAATIVGFAAAGHAIGIELTWSQAGLLAAGVTLATAIPAGPGYIGTYELAGVQIGLALGMTPESAFALTLLAHAGNVLVTSIGGGIALARLGWRPKHRTVEPTDVIVSRAVLQ